MPHAPSFLHAIPVSVVDPSPAAEAMHASIEQTIVERELPTAAVSDRGSKDREAPTPYPHPLPECRIMQFG
ncbi:hypothetical protein [Methylobacterium sp. E-016]|uniref:hypothetical protein n=1 Tax=Methylobacterium sp. E-016 TaxID=2836556 RepID=UPI001FB93FA9|nr:hypothetical protein [Methylobacterium sp. E-016]